MPTSAARCSPSQRASPPRRERSSSTSRARRPRSLSTAHRSTSSCASRASSSSPTDPPRSLEMRRALRPGGRIGLSVWGPIEDLPPFAGLARAVREVIGDEAADRYEHGPWGFSSLDDLRPSRRGGRVLERARSGADGRRGVRREARPASLAAWPPRRSGLMLAALTPVGTTRPLRRGRRAASRPPHCRRGAPGIDASRTSWSLTASSRPGATMEA